MYIVCTVCVYLRPQGLDVVLEGAVLPLQSLHGVLVAAQLLGQLLVLVQDAAQDLLGVVVELVQLEGGGEDLRARVDELQQVGPGLVQPVLPLGDGGGVGVAQVDHLVHHLVHLLHPLLAHAVRLHGELGELLLKDLNPNKWPRSALSDYSYCI